MQTQLELIYTALKNNQFELKLMPYIHHKTVKALAILIGFLFIASFIYTNEPKAKQKAKPDRTILTVKTVALTPTDYQYILTSFGAVQPRTQSLLVSQVSGQVVEVSPVFRDGGFFHKGDTLLKIDPRDYQTAIKVAEAQLLQARASQEEEKAQAQQAQRDWDKLHRGRPAPSLVLRKPQLAAADAQYHSAQANLEKAQLALERTTIKAPYDGRIQSTAVDFGQFVNVNGQLADVFATDFVEIRLPLKNTELDLLELPEANSHDSVEQLPDALINSNLGTTQQWAAKIVRTEAAIDTDSQLLHVVAQIKKPFAQTSVRKTQLKIGQYVTAQISGKRITDALVIPNASIYQGSYVYVLDNGMLFRRDIQIAFQSADSAVIAKGLTFGEHLVVSPLGQVASGTPASSVQTSTKDNVAASAAKPEAKP